MVTQQIFIKRYTTEGESTPDRDEMLADYSVYECWNLGQTRFITELQSQVDISSIDIGVGVSCTNEGSMEKCEANDQRVGKE